MRKSLQVFPTLCLLAGFYALSSAEALQHGEESLDARLVGTHDLQARSAYQPLPVKQGDRRILYVGHHRGEQPNPLTGRIEQNGTSILDVTDASRPVYLSHIPPTGDALGAQMVAVCSGAELPQGDPEKWYLLRPNGNLSHELWDVSVPEAPSFLTTVVTMVPTSYGVVSTHKNWWECDTGIAYLVGSREGWRAPRVLQIFDLSNPVEPRRIRDFSLDGTQPGATGPVPGDSGMHEVFRLGNRLYIPYRRSRIAAPPGPWTDRNAGVIQIVDREKLLHGDPRAADPFGPTSANLNYPEVGRLELPWFWSVHSAIPVLGVDIPDYKKDRVYQPHDFLVSVGEIGGNQCQGRPRDAVFVIDITDEAHPFPVATFQVPEASGNFCDRGGRFGPHGAQWSMDDPFYRKLIVVSYFNAGARVVDIRDPFNPREAAFYIPPTSDKTRESCVTIDGVESCKVAIQTNNVEVDGRGLIYLADRANTGVHIIELTGAAKEILAEPASD